MAATAPAPAPAAGGLHAFAEKGVRKLSQKLEMMKTNYRNAVSRAIANYRAVIPGPTRQTHYANAMNTYAPQNYSLAMTADKIEKWRRNWIAAMSI